MKSTIIFLFIALSCVAIQAFFAMMEMASVSFNRVRLYSYAKRKYNKAIKLKFLLEKPSRLFGTTLVVVNLMVQLGSEASRRFYESLSLNPDLAILSQTVLILFFGEFIPLFTARRFPQHIAFSAISSVYFIAKILSPFTNWIDKLSQKISQFFPGENTFSLYLTKEEIRRVFEEKEGSLSENEQITRFVSKSFDLKNIKAKEIMQNLENTILVSSSTEVEEIKKLLTLHFVDFLVLYQGSGQNIIGISNPSDLILADPMQKVSSYSTPPWFILEDTPIISILKEFGTKAKSVAIVLDPQAKARGFITFEKLVERLFFYPPTQDDKNLYTRTKNLFHRVIEGDMLLTQFNRDFSANLLSTKASTIEELITEVLDHHPYEGEVIYLDGFEFTILEATILGIKKIQVRTSL